MSKKKIHIELTFERVIKFLQCQLITFEKGMYDKTKGWITFDYYYDRAGNFQHCWLVRFPEGGDKKGPQKIQFGEIFEDSESWHLTKEFFCEDILAFAREWEYTMQTCTENFSYLYEVDYVFMLPVQQEQEKSDEQQTDSEPSTKIVSHFNTKWS